MPPFPLSTICKVKLLSAKEPRQSVPARPPDCVEDLLARFGDRKAHPQKAPHRLFALGYATAPVYKVISLYSFCFHDFILQEDNGVNLYQPKELTALLERHGFHFSRRFGQNFLIQQWVVEKIASSAVQGAQVGALEIGPGVGSLTVQLAPRCEKVVCVELDRTLLPLLEETLAPFHNVEVLSGDILKLDLPALTARQFQGLTPVVCANLPYNITTPVLTALLRAGCFADITVMVQREVAQRICAKPGSKEYGAFSLLCRYYAQCQYLFDVGPECFLPAPKVTSAVVRLTPRPCPVPVKDEDAFFRVVRGAFGQRRKTLLNALSSAFGDLRSKEELRAILLSCGLPEDVRGERLDIPEFAALTEKIFA